MSRRKEHGERYKAKTFDQLHKEVDLALEDSSNDNVIKSATLIEKYRDWD